MIRWVVILLLMYSLPKTAEPFTSSSNIDIILKLATTEMTPAIEAIGKNLNEEELSTFSLALYQKGCLKEDPEHPTPWWGIPTLFNIFSDTFILNTFENLRHNGNLPFFVKHFIKPFMIPRLAKLFADNLTPTQLLCLYQRTEGGGEPLRNALTKYIEAVYRPLFLKCRFLFVDENGNVIKEHLKLYRLPNKHSFFKEHYRSEFAKPQFRPIVFTFARWEQRIGHEFFQRHKKAKNKKEKAKMLVLAAQHGHHEAQFKYVLGLYNRKLKNLQRNRSQFFLLLDKWASEGNELLQRVYVNCRKEGKMEINRNPTRAHELLIDYARKGSDYAAKEIIILASMGRLDFTFESLPQYVDTTKYHDVMLVILEKDVRNPTLKTFFSSNFFYY